MNCETVVWKGRCGPFELRVGAATFRPSTVSVLLAESMEIGEGFVVVDAGCGSGVLSIVAAKLGAAMVYGVDAAPETVEVATANALAQGVGDRTRFFRGDIFEPLPADEKADVIIGDVSGIPDDLATVSGWFPSGLAGGPSGAELPMRMLEEARRLLRRGGKLFLPTGTLQDEGSILDKARSVFGSIRQLSERRIPLPSGLADQPAVLRLLRDRVIDLTERGSRLLWTARVWEVTA
ncbi:MAG: 50S ribosomal protein L11 methyltransferase [Acidimicrobiia bacterium]|nr:50S ribosomal protein L11 methyltransferase [Acidimicrobiia bacterium]